MVSNYTDNNRIILVGKITSEKTLSHEIYGESFYVFDIEVLRLSGSSDIIPITISERSITDVEIKIGNKIVVEGQFRSHNNYDNIKNKLVLTVFVRDIAYLKEEELAETANEVSLNGYICKKPIYRQTPFGREIADILLAVNRAYNKSDYIPCITWGRNARFCQNLDIGTQVKVIGRVQSRTYEKKYEDGTVEKRVAYEVSVSRLELVNEDDTTSAEDLIGNNQEVG